MFTMQRCGHCHCDNKPQKQQQQFNVRLTVPGATCVMSIIKTPILARNINKQAVISQSQKQLRTVKHFAL